MKRFIEICQFVLVLFGLMLIGLFLTGLLGAIPGVSTGSLEGQWLIFAGQNILAFILPSMIAWKICFHKPAVREIEADRFPTLKITLFALVAYAVAIPALNQIVWWNSEMHLPDALSEFEQWCRKMEDLAEAQTNAILNAGGLWHTVVNILIIGVLTGIGEEFFFRGAFQRMLMKCRVNPHVAIWTAAFVFSAMHFQFFGFVPRMLLGAWFGYLYWWSGSIWLNSLAHAVNNSLVIIFTRLIADGHLSEDFDMVGVATTGFPVVPAVSAAIFAILTYAYTSRSKSSPTPNL